ncbi:MAG TPA: NADH-quinone oxidoreductase subunit A [Gemmataceae bacterium]|nr:NADH-quinone oxidoreductase subunit A [Gemmataceae bacterium]
MTPLAAYLLLFVAVGAGFIFVHLMAGKLIRPNKPFAAKRTIYECGEPTIGSAWIQFDLRFYVVALLFVIFDVEVAFFFPWAVVFGKANALAAVAQPTTDEEYRQYGERAWELVPPTSRTEHGVERDILMGKAPPRVSADEAAASRRRIASETQQQARLLSWLALLEIAVFFGVLLVGYAYLWRRGDLAWVRSLAAERPTGETPPSLTPPIRHPTPQPVAGTVVHS